VDIRTIRVIKLAVTEVTVAASETLMERMAVVVGVGTTVIIDALAGHFFFHRFAEGASGRFIGPTFSLFSFLFRF